MEEKKDSASQYYFNELKEDEILEHAKEIVLENIPMEIWVKGKENKAQEFSPAKFDPKLKKIWLEFETSMFEPSKSALVEKEILLKADLGRIIFFGETKLLWDDAERSHYIELVGKFYRSQQRGKLRIEANGIKIDLLIEEKTYEGFDFSAGGTSFFTTEDFTVGSEVNNIKVTINKEVFRFPKTKVVKILDVDQEKRPQEKRVALTFENLGQNMEVKITKLVEGLNN